LSEGEKKEIVYIEVDKILVPEERVTSIYDEELEAELEQSIKQHGILQPLQIALVNGQYVLIDGLHRLRIAKKLGMKTVPCIVKQMSEDQLLITNLIMNRQRGKSNPAQEALVIKKLVDEYGYDVDKAAQILGMSRATAEKYYRIADKCSQRVLQALGQGLIPVGGAYWLSFLEDKSKQDEILDYGIKWGYTVEQYKSAVMSIITPKAETPYIMMETGEMKPRPIKVYPCGREVDPSQVVMIPFDRECWPIVEEALKKLCEEGFFYGEKVEQPEETASSVAEGEQELSGPVPPPQPTRPLKKTDWFLESL
jgi:ParB/RepB/Spo0J family partition protein